MDEAAIPHAIELLVGLLGLAAFVAIVARPLRLPYTVALVVAGLARRHRRRARPDTRASTSRPTSSCSSSCPGSCSRRPIGSGFAELRRWFGGLALLAVPGVADLGGGSWRSS